jgi:hypothetical protein
MVLCKIDNIDIASLGFSLMAFDGFLTIDERKPTGGTSDQYSSMNAYPFASRKASPEPSIQLVGWFGSISEREEAICSLYGKIVTTGEKTFEISGNSQSVSVKGFVHNGAKSEIYHGSYTAVITIKILKSND